MFVTIISDCRSQNDIGRLETRYSSFFPDAHIVFIGVESNLRKSATLEAAGNLIDALDAAAGEKGIIAVNVAPRGSKNPTQENGSPFAYFFYKETLVTSTINGYTLSLIKKLKLVDKVFLLDTKDCLDYAFSKKLIGKKAIEYIFKSQFRSFEFQPRVTFWLLNKEKIPARRISLDKILDAPTTIWLIDSFGNAKTTLLIEDLKPKSDNIKTNLGIFPFYERLKDVPDGETAFYIGSSGIKDKRFIEIATQNREGSAAKRLKLKVGTKIKLL